MKDHSKRNSEKRQQRTVRISEIRDDPGIEGAKVPYLIPLGSRVSELQNDSGQRPIVMLRDITGESDPEDDKKVTKHLYKECLVLFVVPQNAKITKEPANNDLSEIWKIRCGDGHVFISTKHFNPKPKPGDVLEGRGEVKVKMVNDDRGTARYPYLNIWEPLEKGELPEYFIEFNSIERYVPEDGSFDLSHASGKERTILHATKFRLQDSNVSSGITITDKRGK